MTNKNYVLQHYPNFIIRKINDPHFGKCFRVANSTWRENMYFSEGKTEAKAWEAAKKRVIAIIDESVEMATIVELSINVDERNKAARRLLWLNPTENQLSLITENCTFDEIIKTVEKIIRLNVDISYVLTEWCQIYINANSGKVTLQQF